MFPRGLAGMLWPMSTSFARLVFSRQTIMSGDSL
jgi:hypothetical protein